MAEKKIFLIGDDNELFKEEIVEYQYYSGFAMSQKQKCAKSLHKSIQEIHPDKNILEVSSKSLDSLGVKLSAFNLECPYGDKKIPVECIFQGGKVFEKGGPYTDLLDKTPLEAKKDSRIRESGEIIGFRLGDKDFPTEPKTLFYDWIYINALYRNPSLVEELKNYQIFTDIEFNHKKSINCQARSVAVFMTLLKRGQLEDVLKTRIKLNELY